MANDFTVKAGSMARRGVEKFLRMQQRALKTGKPVLYLMDSSGGRIDQQTGFFANREGIGKYYYNHSMLSGYVPQICVLYGPCIAGAAYTPVFADFTVMVEGMSAMAIASPRMVKMVTGEEISMQDLGGARMHAEESGSADLVARDEAHARELVSQLITYLPDNAGEDPAPTSGTAPKHTPEGVVRRARVSPTRAMTCRRHRASRRCWVDTRTPARLRQGNRHRVRPHRRSAGRHRRQPAHRAVGSHLPRRRREGRGVHLDLRRLRDSAPLPL